MKVIDMHCDTIFEIAQAYKEGRDLHLRDNHLNVSLNKMKQGDYLLQNFAIFTPLEQVDDPVVHAMNLIDVFYQEIEANQDMIDFVYCYEDIEKNRKKGKMSALLTLEEGAVVHHDLAFLRNYYRLGVRMIALNWNYINGIGYPNFNYQKGHSGFHCFDDQRGLTDFGVEYVKECERLGIIIDVSHLSDAGFFDVLKYTKQPFVASHSNARALCDHARNLTDEMIRLLADRGGVMGINFAQDFLNEGDTMSRISSMVHHMTHIRDVGGIDVIALGTDFDGIPQNLEIKDASMMPLLKDALLENGFTEEEVEKIFYKNVLRVYKQVINQSR